MKRMTIAAAATAALALAGCGASQAPQTPQQQVRSLETQAEAGIINGHPEGGCKLTTDAASCLQGVMTAKAMNLDLASMMPSDWRSRIAHATVTVTGSTATMSETIPGSSGGERFIKQGGQWLIVQEKN
jgi:hypothetical protein